MNVVANWRGFGGGVEFESINTELPQAVFGSMMPVFEKWNIIHGLDRMVTVIT
jgi:hypothetical protein